jgi:putative FmdB family regulatory protein
MPTYSYRCDQHEKPVFSYVNRSIDQVEQIPDCPDCGGLMIRVFDAIPTHFSGSGYYSTDSRAK